MEDRFPHDGDSGSLVEEPGTGNPACGVVEMLSTGWRFGPARVAEGGESPSRGPALEDATLPHCVRELSWRDWDYRSWQEVWLYQREFDLPHWEPAGNCDAATEEGEAGHGSNHRSLWQPRIFLDFAGAMHSATPTVNGHRLPSHTGGYLPFSYEVTDYVNERGNVISLELDSRWSDVPPQGDPRGTEALDYLEPGGLYREVSLRVVPQVFLADVFAKPTNVLSPEARAVEVECTLDLRVVPDGPLLIEARLVDDEGQVRSASRSVSLTEPGQSSASLTLTDLQAVRLWDVEDAAPALYTLDVTVSAAGDLLHSFSRRIGFREARFERDGFFLNGRRLQIFGLNRHQLYPYAGMAMPPRVQRRDALLLKTELNCNMVRCSHYPQSSHFLDACDEVGLMVWDEPPGWQFLGDSGWRDLVVRDVRDMVTRDRNHPSVIIWGVRVNESANDTELYTRTKKAANELDGSRQTSGSMVPHSTDDWVQDVFAFDDYSGLDGKVRLGTPLPDVPYFVAEAVGAIVGSRFYRRTSLQAVQQQQAELHARVHGLAGLDQRYAGLLAWCGFDYASYTGNVFQGLKWPGVCDTFRVPKPGAAFYQSQVDPDRRPVVQPAFYWDFGAVSPVTSLGSAALVFSNCDTLRVFVGGEPYATLSPDRSNYPGLRYPPFRLDVSEIDGSGLPDLTIEGYVGDQRVVSRSFASDPSGDHLEVTADDPTLLANGWDATRITFRAVDRYGAPRPYAQGTVAETITGPGTLIGDNPFSFSDNGGVGAVWVRTMDSCPGWIMVTISHPTLGAGTARVLAE